MKIKVSDLKPNPFRNIKKYPLNPAKLDALRNSIRETGFWDNIVVRKAPKGKGYEIAYGHHRVPVLRDLKIKEVDLPVRKLDDSMMIRIMANENHDAWGTVPVILTETVLAAKTYLDGELGKAEKLECLNESIKALFKGAKGDFSHCKSKGVGQTILLKFLGDNFKQWMIQSALEIIRDNEKPADEGGVSREAVEQLPRMEQANRFRSAVKAAKLPKKAQIALAKKIVKEDISSRDIKGFVEENIPASRRTVEFQEAKEAPLLSTFLDKLSGKIWDLTSRLEPVKGNLGNVQSRTARDEFVRNVKQLHVLLTELLSEANKETSNVKKKAMLV